MTKLILFKLLIKKDATNINSVLQSGSPKNRCEVFHRLLYNCLWPQTTKCCLGPFYDRFDC